MRIFLSKQVEEMIELLLILAGFIFGVAAVIIYTVAVWEINEREELKRKSERGE